MDQAGIQLALTRHQQIASGLLTLLDKESTAVIEGNVDELQRLTQDKKARCDALGELGTEMNSWLRQRPLDVWLRQQSAPVRETWAGLAETLKQCRRKNDANGLLISRRQLEIEQKLRPMRSDTYGATGETQTQQRSSLSFQA